MTGLLWELGSVDENQVAEWVADVVPGPAPVAGPVAILQRKRWGITAVYRRGRRRVVVKISRPALFPQAFLMESFVATVAGGRAPELLGHGSLERTHWSMFEYVAGPTADADDGLWSVGPATQTAGAVKLIGHVWLRRRLLAPPRGCA